MLLIGAIRAGIYTQSMKVVYSLGQQLRKSPFTKKKLLERVKEFLTLCNLVLRRPFLPSFLQQIHIVLWEKHVSPVVPFHP